VREPGNLSWVRVDFRAERCGHNPLHESAKPYSISMGFDRSRNIVLVSGAPGAGKSTLAHPLAHQLGFPLISKDCIKESLFDSLKGTPNDLSFSRRIGGAAMELLWTLAEQCPNVVLEANFRPHSEYERARIASLQGPITEIYCRCPLEEAARRFQERAQLPEHHPAHPGQQVSASFFAEFDRPVGIGRVVEVDTTQPVDVELLVDQLNKMWKSSS